MAMTLSQIISDYGAYYLGDQSNMERLYKLAYRKSGTDALFNRVMTTDSTQVRSAKSSMSRSGAQSWQKAWTPVGDITFLPWKHDLFRVKINNEQTPDELYDSWLQFLTDINDVDRLNWPFVRWWLEEHVIPLWEQEKEESVIYKGIYAPPTPGTAGTLAGIMDGIGKKLVDQIAAGRTTAFVMGTVPASNDEDLYDYIYDMVKQIDTKYRRNNMEVVMATELADRFKEGKRLKFNLQYQQASDLETLYHLPNVKIVGVDSMTTNSRMFITPAENRVRFVNPGARASNMFDVDKVDFVKVRAFTDWHETYGFHIPELVFCNDQV